MSTDAKDKFDALIASTIRGTLDNPGPDCPDVLGAYASRLLDPAELQRWDEHVARCALCQRALAALARAGAVGPAIETQPLGSRRQLRVKPRPRLLLRTRTRARTAQMKPSSPLFAAAFRFMLGPFPLSVTLHVIGLLFLIITVHEQRGRELIMVNLEAGGGGGGGSEMQDLDMPEVPMPDTAAADG
jgi:hypothetical protein